MLHHLACNSSSLLNNKFKSMELSQSSLYGEQLFNFYQTAEATVSVKAALPTNSCRQLPTVHLHTGMLLPTFTLQTHKAQVTEMSAIESISFEKCQKSFSHRMKAFMKDMNEKLSHVKAGQSHSLLCFHQREHICCVCHQKLPQSFNLQLQKETKPNHFYSNGMVQTVTITVVKMFSSIILISQFSKPVAKI